MQTWVVASSRQTQALVSLGHYFLCLLMLFSHYKHPKYLQSCLIVLGHCTFAKLWSFCPQPPPHSPLSTPNTMLMLIHPFQYCFGGRGLGKLINDFPLQNNASSVGILLIVPRTFGQDCRKGI